MTNDVVISYFTKAMKAVQLITTKLITCLTRALQLNLLW